MPKYLVFPMPVGLVEIKASNATVARNKHRKAFLDLNEEELIIVPSSLGKKTFYGHILELHKCSIEKV